MFPCPRTCTTASWVPVSVNGTRIPRWPGQRAWCLYFLQSSLATHQHSPSMPRPTYAPGRPTSLPPLDQATIPSPNPQHPFLTKHPEGALPRYTPPSPGPAIQCSAHRSQDKAPPLTQLAQKAPGTSWPSSSLTCTSPSTTLNIIPCLPVPFLWPSPSPLPATDHLLFPSGLCQKAPSFGTLSHTPGPGGPATPPSRCLSSCVYCVASHSVVPMNPMRRAHLPHSLEHPQGLAQCLIPSKCSVLIAAQRKAKPRPSFLASARDSQLRRSHSKSP